MTVPLDETRRSAVPAALLAWLLPGAGHFYLGDKKKGIAYLAGVVGLQLFGLDLDLTVIGLAVGVPLELGATGLWLFSIADAYRTAKSMDVVPPPPY